MGGQKDANGFELQTTMSSSTERLQSIPTEAPKVPANRNSTQGPPKPSKSSALPSNGNSKTTVSVENGNAAKSKAKEAGQGGFLAVNVGYFKSWQALLKAVKLVSKFYRRQPSVEGCIVHAY